MPCRASYGLNLTYKGVIMNNKSRFDLFSIVFTAIDTIYWITVISIGVFIGNHL